MSANTPRGPPASMIDSSMIAKSAAEPGLSRRLEVKAWPDMNMDNWRRWGFEVGRILRTPRHHFFLQPRRATVSEIGGVSPGFMLEGEWYHLDEELERRIGKAIWPVYVLILLLFAGMLQAMWVSQGFVAAVLFVLMYIVIEGFMPFSLRVLAADTRAAQVEIPWNSITRTVLLPGAGILLLGWEKEKAGLAVAMQLHPETAGIVFESLRNALPEKAAIRVAENVRLANPPSDIR